MKSKKMLLGLCETKPKIIGTILVPVGMLTALFGWIVSSWTEVWIDPETLAASCAKEKEDRKNTDSEE